MTTNIGRRNRNREAVALGRPPEFDPAAAEALAIVTLFASGEPGDAEMAGCLLEELLIAPGGARRVAHGLSSVCAGLLALLEFYGRVPPEAGLNELGHLIAQANTPT